MIDSCKTLAKHRLERAEARLQMADFLFSNGKLMEASSSFYYAMFYCARALLALHNVDSKSHSGVNHLFNTHYIAPAYWISRLGKL